MSWLGRQLRLAVAISMIGRRVGVWAKVAKMFLRTEYIVVNL